MRRPLLVLALVAACGGTAKPEATRSSDDTTSPSTSDTTTVDDSGSTGDAAAVTWPCVPVSVAAQGTGSWGVTSAPEDAEVVFGDASSPTTSFQADLPGLYALDFGGTSYAVAVADLVVTDPGDGTGAPVPTAPLALRDAIELAQACAGPHEVIVDLDGPIALGSPLQVSSPKRPAFLFPEQPTVDNTQALTLIAASGRTPSISGQGTTRLFELQDVHLVIDGIDLVDGLADDGAGGGAVRMFDAAALTLRSLTLSGHHSTRDGGAVVSELLNAVRLEEVEAHDNHADGDGGVVALWSGSLTIEDSDLHDNVAGERGGAAYAWDALTIDGSTLTHNAATDGGAVASEAWLPTLQHSTLSDNTASDRGGAVHFGQPFLGIQPQYGTVLASILDSTLERNRAEGDGGAVHGLGFTEYRLTNTDLVDNSAGGRGGAVALEDSAWLEGVRFEGNEADGDGGGLFITARWDYGNLDFVMTDVSLLDNVAGGHGGAASVTGPWSADILDLVATGNHAAGDGGGVHLSGVDMIDVAGGEVAQNHADGNGGGLSLVSAAYTPVLALPTGPFDDVDLDLWVHDNTAGGDGGGVYLVGSTARMGGAVIEDNGAAGAGGGVCNVDADVEMASGVLGNAPDDFCDPSRVEP